MSPISMLPVREVLSPDEIVPEGWPFHLPPVVQLLRDGLGMAAGQIADVFAEWNKGDLDSYLIEITAEVLKQVDAKTGKPLVDVIVDRLEDRVLDELARRGRRFTPGVF